jgi:hypothetical protein
MDQPIPFEKDPKKARRMQESGHEQATQAKKILNDALSSGQLTARFFDPTHHSIMDINKKYWTGGKGHFTISTAHVDLSLPDHIGPPVLVLSFIETESFDAWIKRLSTRAINQFRTGAPGAPTAMHVIGQEFERRVNDGEIEGNLRAEAKALSKWLTENHPTAPTTTPKTIENKLRDAYRTAKAPK